MGVRFNTPLKTTTRADEHRFSRSPLKPCCVGTSRVVRVHADQEPSPGPRQGSRAAASRGSQCAPSHRMGLLVRGRACPFAPPESRHSKMHARCTGRQGGVGAGFSGGKWYKPVHSHHCVLCNGYHVPDGRPSHTQTGCWSGTLHLPAHTRVWENREAGGR